MCCLLLLLLQSQEEEEEEDMVTRHSCHRQPCPKGSEEEEEVQISVFVCVCVCVCVCWCIRIHIIYIFRYVSFKRVSRDRRLNIFGYIISTSTYIKAARSQFLFCVMCMLFSNLALLMLYERALSLSLWTCYCTAALLPGEEVQHLVSLIHLLVCDRTKVEHWHLRRGRRHSRDSVSHCHSVSIS